MAQPTVINNATYQPYDRYVDSHGLRIFSLDEVSESFIKKVAVTYDAMHASNSSVDTESRATFKAALENNYVFQKVGISGPDYYGGGANLVNGPQSGNYDHNQTDFIWEGTTTTASGQTNEVIEHLLHTVTAVGFNILYPEWKWNDSSSSINLAMQQAIDGSYYDISSYAIVTDPEDHMKTVATEFAYWLVLAEWEYFDVAGISADHPEFTLRTASDIANHLPLAHQLYLDTFAKIFSVPDKTLIQSVYSRETEYDFSAPLNTVLSTPVSEDINPTLSTEEVSKLYVAIFGRASEGEGNDYWAAGHNTTKSAADAMFLASAVKEYFGVPEFTSTESVRTVVETIYLNALGKTSATDSAGIDYWIAEVSPDKSIGEVVSDLVLAANNIANAGIAQDTFNNKVLVSNYVADNIAAFTNTSEFTAYISSVDNTTASVTTARLNIAADASSFALTANSISLYEVDNTNNDYLKSLYNNILGHDSNSSDYDFLLDHLDAGTITREKLFMYFEESTENEVDLIELIASNANHEPYDMGLTLI